MTPEQFCYWLQGFFEIVDDEGGIALSCRQVSVIRDHLSLVLDKRTPERKALSDLVRTLPPDPNRRIC